MSMGLDHINGSAADTAEKALDDLVTIFVEPGDGASDKLTFQEQEALEHLVARVKAREASRLYSK